MFKNKSTYDCCKGNEKKENNIMSTKLQPVKQFVILGNCPKCMEFDTDVKDWNARIGNIGKLKYRMIDLICNDCKYVWELYGALIMDD